MQRRKPVEGRLQLTENPASLEDQHLSTDLEYLLDTS